MPYTPELNESVICSLRRLAWSVQKPMSKVLEEATLSHFTKANKTKVCKYCQDQSKCSICLFNNRASLIKSKRKHKPNIFSRTK